MTTLDEIEVKVRKIFIERLFKVVPDDAYKANPDLAREVYLDTIYTDIMAIGYNYGNKEKAIDDIYETQSQLPWFENVKDLRLSIQSRVEETALHYPEEIKIFSTFHTKTQNGEEYNKVYENIKSLLLS